MNPMKVRSAAALAVAVLGAWAGSGMGTAPPRKPIAVPSAVSNGIKELAEPRSSKVRTEPVPVAKAPVAIGEPSGHPTLVYAPPAPAPPPTGYLESVHADQYHATRSGARGGNHWALIIGINDYAAPTRDNVGSYQDAVSLRSYLLKLGWRSDHILLIANGDASRSHAIQGLQWLASKTDNSSTVVFHYSGHETPYHSDVDGDGESLDVALWMADNRTIVDGELGRLMGRVHASKMWLNFAVCRAGGFDDPGTIKSGRILTYSSPQSELSYEDPSVSHSVFGYYSIVEGMQSGTADSNGDGVTTVQEAFSYAKPRVTDRTGDKQHPFSVDQYGKAFSLVAPVPPAPPKPQPQSTPTPTPCTLPVGCTRVEP